MPRTQKIITPKGERYPGSGRVKGQPNKISVELKQLVSELVNDPDYQRRLRHDFSLRRLHPTMESIVWAYHLGKPRQDVNVTATVDINARIEEERRIFAALDLHDLEQLAAESQALVDRAAALGAARVNAATPQHLVIEQDLPEVSAETLGKEAGSDNLRYVAIAEPTNDNDAKPTDTEG